MRPRYGTHYCYLPLYVFCGRHLLVAYLRRSDIDAVRHGWAILALLVKALRQQWPGVEIVLRADSGFCRWRMLRWCERQRVRYVVGIARNPRLLAMCEAQTTREVTDFLPVSPPGPSLVTVGVRITPEVEKRTLRQLRQIAFAGRLT